MAKIQAITPIADQAISPDTAETIFELIERFASYGFNRSHAAAYAVLAFRTAYLRCRHPHEFYAASMNLELSNSEKLSELYYDAKRHGVAIETPNVQIGRAQFSVAGEGPAKRVIWALAGIKGVGLDAIRDLVAERSRGGRFASFADFVRRASGFLNKRAFQNLIKAGACDALHGNRAEMLAGLDGLLKGAQKDAREQALGQASLFGDLLVQAQETLPKLPELPFLDLRAGEWQTLNIYIKGHPLDLARNRLKSRKIYRTLGQALDIETPLPGRQVITAGIVIDLIPRTNSNGEPWAILKLSDPSGLAEISVYAKTFARYRRTLRKNDPFIFTCEVKENQDERRLAVDEIEELSLDPALDGTRPTDAIRNDWAA